MNSLEKNVLQSAKVINLLKIIKKVPLLSAFIKSIIIWSYNNFYLWKSF